MEDNKVFNQEITDFFKAFGNEKRQEMILSVFSDGQEHNITEVAERVKIAQSTASEHLSFLKRAGILASRKVEKEVYYKISKQGVLHVIEELHRLVTCCCPEE